MVERYWYPLTGQTPSSTVALKADAFHRDMPDTDLREILLWHSIDSLFELREWGPEYEMDVAFLSPSYNGSEGYWTAGNMDWLIYASHHNSVTIAGEWLLREIQRCWPTWNNSVW